MAGVFYIKEWIAVCKDEGRAWKATSLSLSEQQMIEYASEASKYDELRERVNLIRFGSKPRKKKRPILSARIWQKSCLGYERTGKKQTIAFRGLLCR